MTVIYTHVLIYKLTKLNVDPDTSKTIYKAVSEIPI